MTRFITKTKRWRCFGKRKHTVLPFSGTTNFSTPAVSLPFPIRRLGRNRHFLTVWSKHTWLFKSLACCSSCFSLPTCWLKKRDILKWRHKQITCKQCDMHVFVPEHPSYRCAGLFFLVQGVARRLSHPINLSNFHSLHWINVHIPGALMVSMSLSFSCSFLYWNSNLLILANRFVAPSHSQIQTGN